MHELGHDSRRARQRKRSHRVWLGLAGLSAGAVLLYELTAARDGAVATDFFETPEQCAASGKYGATDCASFFKNAADEQRQSAPRYASRTDCEADFTTGCTMVAAAPGSSGSVSGDLFVPAVAGILVGGALAARGAMAMPVYDACERRPDNPSCARTGSSGGGGYGHSYHTASGYRVSIDSTHATVDGGALSARAPSATLSRGGFGARAGAIPVAG
jgi:uncharacterized protein YgiB involved in biofilm formation